MDPTRFDLNLLRTLDILDEEQSVQRAASRLHLTPSAVSHALRRLRLALDDPLFVRSGPRLVPTPRCRAVLLRIRPFLSEVSFTLAAPGSAPGFDPSTDRRAITLVMPGAVEMSLLPALAERIAVAAPGWSLAVKGFQRRSYQADLLSADADIVLSVGGQTAPGEGISIATLWRDELVVLEGPSGPLSEDRPVTLDRVVDLPQVYPLPWPRTQNYLDILLARDRRQRAIALSLPGYASLGEVLSRTSLVATLPDRTALAILRRHPGLRVIRVAPAVVTPLALECTERFEASAEGGWFLAELRAVAAAIPAIDPQPA